ncbi:MAG: beta-lactamase family protein [Ignavibacteria bacterium]|nr:beta-lactamase family protein [Ignavibacteria bacterium]
MKFSSAKLLSLITILTFSMITIISPNLPGQISNETRIKQAVDSVRINYEKKANKTIPSLSILIHTPSDYIFVSSTAEGETPLTKDTYFRFASNTKNFTSASILNMQESGWLNIKDKIVDLIPGSSISYVPESPEFNIPYKNEITIEQLLQHSAGVYDIDNDPVPGYNGLSYTDYMTFKNPAHQFELSELVNEAAKNNLSYFPPGKGYHYSNTGYTVLSEIIQRVYSFKTGGQKKYADYIRDFITGSSAPVPLDISFPYLATDVTITSPFATGYLITKDSTNIFTNVNMSAHVGEGNGYATFAELDKYIRSIMKGENVLDTHSIYLMKNSVSDSNKTYALGCIHIKDLGYGHNGCIKGYLSDMLYDPDTDVSVIIMIPVNDYTDPDEEGIIYGLKALVNAGFASRIALGFTGKMIPF